MGFTESIKTCSRKYIDFSGRASRSEYWWFLLFHFIVSAVLVSIGSALPGFIFIWMVYLLAVLLPLLAVTVRRLHDIDQPAWWLLLPLVPLGFIALLVMAIVPGTRGTNRYGPEPLQRTLGTDGYTPPPSDPYAPRLTDPYGASSSAPPSYTPSTRRYCPQCGVERASADARFCTVCGAAF